MAETFGKLLRQLRQSGRDPRTHKLLAMERLGEMIGERNGTPDYPAPQIVWNWENDKNQPIPRERKLLLAIIAALRDGGGLSTVEQANALLDAGGYTILRPDEEVAIFPSKQPIAPPQVVKPPVAPTAPYIERSRDWIGLEAIRQQGVTITISGPHGFGKSLLLNRLRTEATKAGKCNVRFDFQSMDRNDATTFFQSFCARIADQLGLDDQLDRYWKRSLDHAQACTRYVEGYVFKALGASLVLAMDEADRLIHAPFRDKFFGMLRSWHNNRAADPSWHQLDLILAISMDPSQLVTTGHQSPFNVGEKIRLDEFSTDEVERLKTLYDVPLDSAETAQLVGLVGGHPSLICQALAWLKLPGRSMAALLAQATEEHANSPFRSHLESQLDLVKSSPALSQAMLQVLRSQRCSEEAATQLDKAGLIRLEGKTAMPRCRLYARYFGDRLQWR